MIRLFFKRIFILFTIALVGCVPQNNEPAQIRLVDLNGNYRMIKTRVPEANASVLASQGKLRGEEHNFKNNERSELYPNANDEAKITKNKYAKSKEDGLNVDPVGQSKVSQPKKIASNQAETNEVSLQPKPDSTSEPFNGDVGSESSDQEPEALVQDKPAQVKPSQTKVLERGAKPVKQNKKTKLSGIFVQTGSFASARNADQSLAKMKKFHKGTVEIVDAKGKKIYRVLLGPFPSKEKAKKVVGAIKASGKDAIVVKN